VSKDISFTPHTRSWRDIPQPVKPRAMSGGGRRRLLMASARVGGFVAVLMTVGWGLWQVTAVLQHGARKMPSVAKAGPLKDVLLVTDGVLGHPWILETLALPQGISLMELDLRKLRERVLAHGQVRTATLTRNFPDTLAITISERSPVARLKAGFPDGSHRELFVARDGVVFPGVDFDPAMIETLPWLEGFSLARQNQAFLPIAGMEAVAELLAKAKLEAEERYRTWEVVSLARLRSDGEIEVRTQAGTRIVFGTREDYFPQLARLDLLLDTAAKAQPGKTLGEIDLTLGAQVAVSFAALATERDSRGGVPLLKPLSAQSSSPAFPHLQIKLKREL
jgi:cell division protein FtsQ